MDVLLAVLNIAGEERRYCAFDREPRGHSRGAANLQQAEQVYDGFSKPRRLVRCRSLPRSESGYVHVGNFCMYTPTSTVQYEYTFLYRSHEAETKYCD